MNASFHDCDQTRAQRVLAQQAAEAVDTRLANLVSADDILVELTDTELAGETARPIASAEAARRAGADAAND